MGVLNADYPSNHAEGLAFVDFDTQYAFGFYCRFAEDLRVVHVHTTERLLYAGSEFEMYSNSGDSGGYIKLYPESGITGGRLYISRMINKEQRESWAIPQKLLLPKIEGTADYLNRMTQDLMFQVHEKLKKNRYRGAWATGRHYLVGDLSRDGINLYIAVTDHISSGTLAAAVAAGDQIKFYDGDADIAAWYTVPAISGGDAKKALRVNSAATGVELEHIVPKAESGTSGKKPVVNIAKTTYDGLRDLDPAGVRMQYSYDPANPKKLFISSSSCQYNDQQLGLIYDHSTSDYNHVLTVPDVASSWAYMYLTCEVLVGTGLRQMQFSDFGSAYDTRMSTNSPTYYADKGGWYYDDTGGSSGRWWLCLFPVYLDASKNIRPFYFNTRSRMVLWQESHQVYSASMPATWTTVDFSAYIPSVSDVGLIENQLSFGSGSTKILYYRASGSSAATGHSISRAYSTKTEETECSDIPLNSARQCEFMVLNGPATVTLFVNGFYLPRGM